MSTSTATLPNGGELPYLGFGTWRLTGPAATEATRAAIAAGYRHVDTATMYGNEAEVGAALQDGVFVTTKLQPSDAGHARRTLEQSLTKLGRAQLDLWLIHWPTRDTVATWRELIRAQADGLVRDIGVSNLDLGQLDELIRATGVTPAVNQVPWSPYRYDAALLAGHRERGVVLEGYSGLKGGVLTDPVVVALAERLGRTPAQVLLRWHLAHDVVVIPKSSDPDRIAANADLDFALDPADAASLDALARS